MTITGSFIHVLKTGQEVDLSFEAEVGWEPPGPGFGPSGDWDVQDVKVKHGDHQLPAFYVKFHKLDEVATDLAVGYAEAARAARRYAHAHDL